MNDCGQNRTKLNGTQDSAAKRIDALRRKAWRSSPTRKGRRVLKDAEAVERRHAAIVGD